MRHKKIRLSLYALLSLGIMCLIFYLSSQPAPVSQELSDGLLLKIMHFLGFEDELRMLRFGKLIRKMAHLAEYALLSLSLGLFFTELPEQKTKRRPCCRAFLVSAVYAISDELHQFFVPGRSMQLSDVLIDCIGAAAGLAFLYFLHIIISKERGAEEL